MHSSRFNAGLGSFIWLILWTSIVNGITLGLAFPWTMCARYGWRINNQVVNGQQMRFDGTGGQLIGKWLLWWFLIIITFGIYAFWVPIKIIQWQTEHTFMPTYEAQAAQYQVAVNAGAPLPQIAG